MVASTKPRAMRRTESDEPLLFSDTSLPSSPKRGSIERGEDHAAALNLVANRRIGFKASDEMSAVEQEELLLRSPDKNVPSAATFRRIHCAPVHVECVVSPLSTESVGSSYRGFINLTILLLAVNMIRLVIENLNKYGVLLSLPGKHVPVKDYNSLLGSLSIVLTCVFIAWVSERLCLLRVQNRRSLDSRFLQFCTLVLILFNFVLLLVFPAWIIWTHAYHPTTGFIALLASLTLTMKLISYHVVNWELRKLYISTVAADRSVLKTLYPDCVYPANLSLKNLMYFWVAPTLCYQPSYPRIPQLRKMFLAKRLCECASALVAMYVMIEQYAVPTVRNSLKPLNELDWIAIFERVLKLSTTSLYIWLLGFYAFFHSALNATAELLRFGDRGFYRDWWNAQTVDEYWRLWNAPVHFWLKRHVYVPLRRRSCSPLTASILIFVLSAAGHEYLVAVATHLLQGWALGAMLFQIPLIAFTRWHAARWPHSSFGNYFFWITFCILGMPMCVLFYYRAWVHREFALNQG